MDSTDSSFLYLFQAELRALLESVQETLTPTPLLTLCLTCHLSSTTTLSILNVFTLTLNLQFITYFPPNLYFVLHTHRTLISSISKPAHPSFCMMPLNVFPHLLLVVLKLLDLPDIGMLPCPQCCFPQPNFPTLRTCPCPSALFFTPVRFRTIILLTHASVQIFREIRCVQPPIPPQQPRPFSSIFSFRSSFQFLGQASAPTPTVPVVTSSGRIARVAVGDTVLLVEHFRYRVQKLFPADRRVVLQKINTRDRPFTWFTSQIWVSPPAVAAAAADNAFPSVCDCPELEPPRFLPDTSHLGTQAGMETSTAHDTWCLLFTDYSSDDQL